MEKMYTIEDLAAFTGLTDRTLRSYLKDGRLSGTKEEGAWRFSSEDLGRLLQDGAAETPWSMTSCWAGRRRTAAV